MSLNFSSEYVAFASLVNVEIYELFIPCFFFVTIYVFAVLLS